MSEVFTYICTKTTADPYVPAVTADIRYLSRGVSDAFAALAGGHFVVGRLVMFPLQRSVPFHLLCDGREVLKASFPELYEFLSDSQGTATDANSFVLPNYIGTLTPAATTVTETETQGTVSTPVPVGAPSTEPYGDKDSGGRFRGDYIP